MKSTSFKFTKYLFTLPHVKGVISASETLFAKQLFLQFSKQFEYLSASDNMTLAPSLAATTPAKAVPAPIY